MVNAHAGVLSCSNIDAGNNPVYFPGQNFYPASVFVNDVIAEPVNFHLEPLQIGNLFQGSLPSSALTFQAFSAALALPLLLM
jgi:hypothetical protein